MLSNLYTPLIAFFITVSSFLSAMDYEIRDIGTLQTHSSQAIAINNQGQILGWYNIDGSKEGKHFFVRDRDGSFHEVSSRENNSGWEIEWRYLTNDGKAYGVFDGNSNFAVLYTWDQKNGVVKLGNLPGKEISAINDAGQVLITSVVENEGGKTVIRPIIWQNGSVTKLKCLEGDLGIESDESYGYDMNNHGDVVGKSRVSISYKNNLYTQIHATKWVNGQAIDLHDEVPKSVHSSADAINDSGDVLIGGYLLRQNGTLSTTGKSGLKTTNKNYMYDTEKHGHSGVYDTSDNKIIDNSAIANKVIYDTDSIWLTVYGIVGANDDGEIIAQAVTIYGEEHVMLLVPIKAE